MQHNPFTKHPHSINETYLQHFKHAGYFGMFMVLGGLSCLIHAIFPFWFKRTGSHFLLKMTQEFINRSPILEERIISIKECIDNKKCINQNNKMSA